MNGQTFHRKYNQDALVQGLELETAAGGDLASGLSAWAAGEVQLSKDGGAFADRLAALNETPAASGSWRLTLPAADLVCKTAVFKVARAGAIRPVLFRIETYGHPSAQIRADFGTAWLSSANAGALTQTPRPLSGDLEAVQYARWRQTWQGIGLDSTGWEAYTLTIKEDADKDDDDDALLTVRVSNPADATNDGLLRLNRCKVPTADQGLATLTVTPSGADTTVSVDVKAAALGLLAGGTEKPWGYQIDRWMSGGGGKETVGSGTLAVLQAVRRGTDKPLA